MGAKGFGLPSVSLAVGISKMLESCKLRKAESEKIESFSLMFLTFKSTERKSLPISEV
jgi:hypothetical protein